jgi:hypothetical protein
MKKIILALLSGLSLFFSAQGLAAELKIYAKQGAIHQADVGEKGYSVGDIKARYGTVYFEDSADAKAVGEFFTQSQITHIDTKQKKDVRFVVMEFNLPDGEIMTMDFTPVESEPKVDSLRPNVQKHRGVIVGGTGKYNGIKGSYELFLHPDTSITVIVFNSI